LHLGLPQEATVKKLAVQYALVSWGEGERTLEPGSSLTLGRHARNDVVFREAGVSRFHATVSWREGDPCPVVFDLGSQNGTRVDGAEVRRGVMPLRHGAIFTVGSVEILVQFKNCDESALLLGTTDLVALFTERGTLIEGDFESGSDLGRVFQQLEAERRTGTLHVLPQSLDAGTVTLCQGRVMAVQWRDSRKTRALQKLLELSSAGHYRFSADLEPTDNPMALWFSDYLRARRTDAKATRPLEDIGRFPQRDAS
jgi:hypothetical protein